MLTEDEARKKWCPLQGTPLGQQGSFNKCIASECMAWRWVKQNTRETKIVRHPAKYDAKAGTIRVIDGESWRYQYTDVDSDGEFDLLHRHLSDEEQTAQRRQGYCGLAR